MMRGEADGNIWHENVHSLQSEISKQFNQQSRIECDALKSVSVLSELLCLLL